MLSENSVREEELLNEIGDLRTDLECLMRDMERVMYTPTKTLIKNEITRLEISRELLERELEKLEG